MDSKMSVTDKVYMEAGKGFRDDLKMNGHFYACLYDEKGNLKDSREVLNTVTVLGHKMSADQQMLLLLWFALWEQVLELEQ
jgi:hypothetical protein